MMSLRHFLRASAVALSAVLGATVACAAAEAASPAPGTERIQVIAVHKTKPAASDPSNAAVDSHGLLRNGIVANVGSYG